MALNLECQQKMAEKFWQEEELKVEKEYQPNQSKIETPLKVLAGVRNLKKFCLVRG